VAVDISPFTHADSLSKKQERHSTSRSGRLQIRVHEPRDEVAAYVRLISMSCWH